MNRRTAELVRWSRRSQPGSPAVPPAPDGSSALRHSRPRDRPRGAARPDRASLRLRRRRPGQRLARSERTPGKTALGQTADGAEEERNEENADAGGEEHPGEHAGAEGVAAGRSRATRHHQRRDAEDEGERGHENGTEPFARRFDSGLPNRHTALPDLVGKLHDQNRVLGRQSYHRDQSDLEVDVAREAPDPDAQQGAKRSEGDPEEHGERN